MWDLVWKENRHAFIKMLLKIGKIGINMTAWIVAYALYSKSTLFAGKARILMSQPEYMENDVLGPEKIRLVYWSGVFLTGLIAIGIGILFWCMVTTEMKKQQNKMGLFMALGYNRKQLKQYYRCHILAETVIAALIAVMVSLGAWYLFLAFSTDYVEMLKYVGLNQTMDMTGVVYAIIAAMGIQMLVLARTVRKLENKSIRELIAEK